METTVTNKKEQKASKNGAHAAIRVSKATRKLMKQVLDKINNKAFGRKVNVDTLVCCAMSKLNDEDYKTLQEKSLTNQHRFDRDYLAYCAEHGKISKDEYLGKRLCAEAALPKK